MQGEKRIIQERTLYTGWTESEILAVCPTKEELGNLGIDLDDEPVYVKENDEGVDVARIDFWMKEINTGYKYKRSMFLEDSPSESKPKDGDTNSFVKRVEYVNQIGDSVWVKNKKELEEKEGFTKFRRKGKNEGEYEIYGEKSYRIARKGESTLLKLVKIWLGAFDYYHQSTNIFLDLKKIFAGNFKELQEQVNSENTTFTDRHGVTHPYTIVDLLEVKTVTSDEGVKEYQAVNKRPIAGWHMKAIRNTDFSMPSLMKWKKEAKGKSNPGGTRWLKDYEAVAVEASIGEYRSKNYFTLGLFQEYDQSKNYTASKSVVTEDNEITTEDPDY